MRKQVITLFDLSWDKHMRWEFFLFLTLSTQANDPESTVNIDLGVTNKFQQVDKSSNVEFMNNDNQLYILVKIFLDRSDTVCQFKLDWIKRKFTGP